MELWWWRWCQWYVVDDDLYCDPQGEIHYNLTGEFAEPTKPNLRSEARATLSRPQPGQDTRSNLSSPPSSSVGSAPSNTPAGPPIAHVSEIESSAGPHTESEDSAFDPNTLVVDEANLGLSTFLQTGGEHVNVTDEMLARIEAIVQTEQTLKSSPHTRKLMTHGTGSPCELSLAA